jgi:hypothetical protein
MANFIDFVVEVSTNKALGNDFNKMLQKSNPKELANWFKNNGFTVSEDECKKLIENKDSIKKSSFVKTY